MMMNSFNFVTISLINKRKYKISSNIIKNRAQEKFNLINTKVSASNYSKIPQISKFSMFPVFRSNTLKVLIIKSTILR